MSPSEQMHTSVTLLELVRRFPRDEAAWAVFVQRYGPNIQAWCRAWHLQSADADEVSQMVLLKLADKMRTFVYDPSQSFRAWLKTLTHHAWQDYLQSRSAVTARVPAAVRYSHSWRAWRRVMICCDVSRRSMTGPCWRRRWHGCNRTSRLAAGMPFA